MKSWGLKYWKVTSVVGIGEYESFLSLLLFLFFVAVVFFSSLFFWAIIFFLSDFPYTSSPVTFLMVYRSVTCVVEGNQLPLFGGVSLVLRETPAVETSAGLCKANFTQFLKYKSSRNLFQPLLVVIGYVTGYMY